MPISLPQPCPNGLRACSDKFTRDSVTQPRMTQIRPMRRKQLTFRVRPTLSPRRRVRAGTVRTRHGQPGVDSRQRLCRNPFWRARGRVRSSSTLRIGHGRQTP